MDPFAIYWKQGFFYRDFYVTYLSWSDKYGVQGKGRIVVKIVDTMEQAKHFIDELVSKRDA